MNLKVKKVRDYIVDLEGENRLGMNEVVHFDHGLSGIVVRASTNGATVALLEQIPGYSVRVGDEARPTGNEYALKIRNDYLGNIVSVSGEIFTTHAAARSAFDTPDKHVIDRPIFRIARPIYTRENVNQQLHTGIAAIDWAIPIGRGQRELILGDRKTGKTAIAFNMIVAQRATDIVCIYVAIGQKKTSTLELYEKLAQYGMRDRTVIVTASSDQIATKKWLAPYVGMTLAEYYQEVHGKDVLIIFDDLSKHADAYRELSLLLESAPAREAYPGDIFYLHSKLLERAGRYGQEFGGGSITAIPIVQTEAGDITSYIPTNVISITDGQIFTSKSLFNAGQRPAIDIPYSVSRVGSSAQSKSLRRVSGGLKYLVSAYEEARKLVRLSGQALDENKSLVDRGRVFAAMTVQQEAFVLDIPTGILLLTLFQKGHLNFFKTNEELVYVKELLANFLNKDYIGVKVRETIVNDKANSVMIELTMREVVLPFIKFHLLEKYPYLQKDQDFIQIFAGVRDDGRVYSAFARREGSGITNLVAAKEVH